MAVVSCWGAGLAWSQERPVGKKGATKAKVVTEKEAKEDEDVIEIVVRIPKPEALIFSNRMKTRYLELGYDKDFSERIVESAKHSPF
jgi:hypothetical protein